MTTPGEQRTVLAEGRYSRFVRRGTWEYIERVNVSEIVALVAITDAGDLVLVEQYRPPVDRRVLELPAGLVGDSAEHRDEEILSAARRELLEETGYEAGEMQIVAVGPPSAGIVSEELTIILARGLRKTGPGGGDDSEDITVHEVPLDEMPAFLSRKAAEGIPADLKIYAALWFAHAARRL